MSNGEVSLLDLYHKLQKNEINKINKKSMYIQPVSL